MGNKKTAKKRSVKKWYVTAKQNARLADGTFVGEGEKVEVTKEYAERLKAEKNKTFIISN